MHLLLRYTSIRSLRIAIFFLFILLLPTQFGKHWWPDWAFVHGVRVDYLAPKLYTTDLLMLLFVLLHVHELRAWWQSVWKKNKRHVHTYGIVLFILVHTAVSLSVWVSVLAWLHFLLITAGGIVVYRVFSTQDWKKGSAYWYALFAGLLVGACGELILAMWQLYERSSIQGVFYLFGERYMNLSTPGVAKASWNGVQFLRPYGTFSHPNSMGGFYLLVYTLTFFDKQTTQFLHVRVLLLVVSAVLVLVSFSKVCIAIFILLNAAVWGENALRLHNNGQAKSCWLCWVNRVAVLFCMGWIVFHTQGDINTLKKRIELVGDALQIIQTYGLLGTGLGASLVAHGDIPIRYPYHFLQPVHNIFLLWVGEVGIPFALYTGYELYRSLRHSMYKRQILACIAVVALTGLMDHYWLTLQQNALLISIVAGYTLRKRS